jgi:hypothetical protein
MRFEDFDKVCRQTHLIDWPFVWAEAEISDMIKITMAPTKCETLARILGKQ